MDLRCHQKTELETQACRKYKEVVPREKDNHYLASQWTCCYIHTWPGCLDIKKTGWVLPPCVLSVKPSIIKTCLSLQPQLLQETTSYFHETNRNWRSLHLYITLHWWALEVVSEITLFCLSIVIFNSTILRNKVKDDRVLHIHSPHSVTAIPYKTCESLFHCAYPKAIHTHCTPGPYKYGWTNLLPVATVAIIKLFWDSPTTKGKRCTTEGREIRRWQEDVTS